MSADTRNRAGVCTAPADLARQLNDLVNDRDKLRSLLDSQHLHLAHTLQAIPGTEAARHLAHSAWACGEAADRAADDALHLALAALRCCGVVVDLPPAGDAQPELADSEGRRAAEADVMPTRPALADSLAAHASMPVAAVDCKALATLQARAALASFTLRTMTETDGQCVYLLSRWGMSRTLPDLAAVVAFLRQVGAPE